MSLSPDTYTAQSQLAKYCRDGNTVEIPGLTPNRLHQYRRLVFNIIQDSFESGYPISFKYLPTEVWDELVLDFFAIHPCQNFQVWKLPKEFSEFVIENNYAAKHNIPYLNDLLNFEWAEMELYNMPDKPYKSGLLKGDIITGTISLNPEYLLLPLEYPVHIYPPTVAEQKKGNYFVLLFREQETGKIQFIDLSIWYAFIIEQMSQNQTPISELLQYAPQLFGDVSIDELKKNTAIFIQSMIEKKFVIDII
jgi:hypothetical protein